MSDYSIGSEQFQAMLRATAKREREIGLANVGRVTGEWCRCSDTTDQEAYYQRDSGRHGWFHDPQLGGCGGITQTG